MPGRSEGPVHQIDAIVRVAEARELADTYFDSPHSGEHRLVGLPEKKEPTCLSLDQRVQARCPQNGAPTGTPGDGSSITSMASDSRTHHPWRASCSTAPVILGRVREELGDYPAACAVLPGYGQREVGESLQVVVRVGLREVWARARFDPEGKQLKIAGRYAAPG